MIENLVIAPVGTLVASGIYLPPPTDAPTKQVTRINGGLVTFYSEIVEEKCAYDFSNQNSNCKSL